MGFDYEKEEGWTANGAPEEGFRTLDMRFKAFPDKDGGTWRITDAESGYSLSLPSFESCRRHAVHMTELSQIRKKGG